MKRHTDQLLEERARQALEERAGALDAATLSRLRQAREQALANARKNVRLPASGLRWAGALAAGLLLVVGLAVWRNAGQQALPASVDDLEVLASSEDLELYQELDFYLWLEREEGAGDRT